MKIIRNIDGKNVEIELSKVELYDAFVEQEHIWDCDYVRGLVPEHVPEDKVQEIAHEMRRQMNKYDVNIGFAFDEACYACLANEDDVA